MDGSNNGIILYHYSFSPYARRIAWYLALRGIDYAQVIQPPIMPRPDIKALGVSYRRIPVMAIGRDVYCDTRIIIAKLEKLFPDQPLGATTPDQQALQKLLEVWSIDAGLFARASQLIPSNMPLLKDTKFQKDREQFSGRRWTTEEIDRNRPEALTYIRNWFNFLEGTLLADGRDWVLKTDGPSLADIEAVWIVDWLNGLKNALPKDLVSEAVYPRVFAWIGRFNQALKNAKGKTPKPTTLKGNAAADRVLAAAFAEDDLGIDSADPLGLRQEDEVEIYPIDSGFGHRDRGKLVGLSADEVVISLETGVRLHTPRTGFRITRTGAGGPSKL